jgi:hypothetical protein
MRRVRRPGAHLVTEAQRSKSDDISYRERRYLIMMAIRVVCFVIAVVVFANGGREPSSTKGFRAYEPNLPAVYRPPGGDSPDGGTGGAQTDRGGYGDGPMHGNG